MTKHTFQHSGSDYSIYVALVADQPATYAAEVYRDRTKGDAGKSLITLTIRADHDDAFIQSAMPIDLVFQRAEQLIKGLYL